MKQRPIQHRKLIMNYSVINFLKKSLLLIFLVVFTLFALITSTAYLSYGAFNFKIPASKNKLLLGDSKIECAINDEIFSSSFNLAQSGSCYFYSYIKLRETLKHNHHIDTIVLGFSNSNLEPLRDDWLIGEKFISFKLRNHFFLFNTSDYQYLLKANFWATIKNTSQVMLHNLKMILIGYNGLGGFLSLNRQMDDDDLKKAIDIEKKDVDIAKHQLVYLKKIYSLCEKNNLTLILLSAPIHNGSKQKYEHYTTSLLSFKNQWMKNSVIINHQNFELENKNYADFMHLNSDGAKRYSTFLKNNGFANL